MTRKQPVPGTMHYFQRYRCLPSNQEGYPTTQVRETTQLLTHIRQPLSQQYETILLRGGLGRRGALMGSWEGADSWPEAGGSRQSILLKIERSQEEERRGHRNGERQSYIADIPMSRSSPVVMIRRSGGRKGVTVPHGTIGGYFARAWGCRPMSSTCSMDERK